MASPCLTGFTTLEALPPSTSHPRSPELWEWTMSSTFHHLPTDLILEIISFAAAPEVDCLNSIYGRRGTYANALSLTRVSYAFRRATMPHLLRTIVLGTSRDSHLFTRALLQQHCFRQHHSRLALEYKRYVRRFWCTESFEESCDLFHAHDSLEVTVGWDLLYDIISNVQSLGLGIAAWHLLDNGLALKTPLILSSSVQCPYWQSCHRITFAGPFFNWDRLTSMTQAVHFLAHITHLTLWITPSPTSIPTHPRIPSWIDGIPFHMLCSLEELELLLIPKLSEEEIDLVGYSTRYFSPHPLEALVLSYPKSGAQHYSPYSSPESWRTVKRESNRAVLSGASIIEGWLRSPDPLAYGVVYPLDGIPRTAMNFYVSSCWESRFLEGRNPHVFGTVDSKLKKFDCC